MAPISNPAWRPASVPEVLPLRTRHRAEMDCQIVHDSIHRRAGWTATFLLETSGAPAGFGSVAIGGPWTGRPTLFEFYLLPDQRTRAFGLFEAFLAASGARFFEVQTNDALLAVMAHAYGKDLVSEKIVFADAATTHHGAAGATLRRLTSEDEVIACREQRQGGGEWVLDLDGAAVARGGILFHYNRPYGDVYMEVAEPFRRRGLGTYLVQELKRACYDLGAIPGARCDAANLASRRTLQKAGFVPFAHILIGSVVAG
jgi:GNAT superfamily N-acetyltransferase